MAEFPLHNELTVFTWLAVPSSGYHKISLPHKPITFKEASFIEHNKTVMNASKASPPSLQASPMLLSKPSSLSMLSSSPPPSPSFLEPRSRHLRPQQLST